MQNKLCCGNKQTLYVKASTSSRFSNNPEQLPFMKWLGTPTDSVLGFHHCNKRFPPSLKRTRESAKVLHGFSLTQPRHLAPVYTSLFKIHGVAPEDESSLCPGRERVAYKGALVTSYKWTLPGSALASCRNSLSHFSYWQRRTIPFSWDCSGGLRWCFFIDVWENDN